MKKIVIRINSDELQKDIATTASILADANPQKVVTADGGASLAVNEHLLYIMQEEYKPRVMRMIGIALVEANNFLLSVSKQPIEADTTQTNELDDYKGDDVMEFVLYVNDDLPSVAAELLAPYIHEYVLWRTLMHWCTMVSQQLVEICASNVAVSEDKIRKAINRRTGRVRRPLSPF